MEFHETWKQVCKNDENYSGFLQTGRPSVKVLGTTDGKQWKCSNSTDGELVDAHCQWQQDRLDTLMLSVLLKPNKHGCQEHAHVLRRHFVQRHQLKFTQSTTASVHSPVLLQQIYSSIKIRKKHSQIPKKWTFASKLINTNTSFSWNWHAFLELLQVGLVWFKKEALTVVWVVFHSSDALMVA